MRSTAAHPVQGWLDRQEERRRLAILRMAERERSVVASYLYAALLGLEEPIDIYEEWVNLRFERIPLRNQLEDEIASLGNDLAALREFCGNDPKRVADMATKISYLTKELRGHVDQIEKMQAVLDRRALLLAGVEQTARLLRKAFGKQAHIWEAIEPALEASWSEIESKHSLS